MASSELSSGRLVFPPFLVEHYDLPIETTIPYAAFEETGRLIALLMENRKGSERKGWKGLTSKLLVCAFPVPSTHILSSRSPVASPTFLIRFAFF
jgi:hypothetical protein